MLISYSFDSLSVPNPCVDFVCFNGGTCVDGMATQDSVDDSEIIYPRVMNAFCKCLPGFTGKRCESKQNIHFISYWLPLG